MKSLKVFEDYDTIFYWPVTIKRSGCFMPVFDVWDAKRGVWFKNWDRWYLLPLYGIIGIACRPWSL